MIMGKIRSLVIWVSAVVPLLFSCGKRIGQPSDSVDRETMYQVATLQSLMVGNYDGFIQMDDLCQHGDIGIGTFSCANGEMIVLDGHVYQALWDGSVKEVEESETTPFANVTFFDCDIVADIQPVKTLSDLTSQLDSLVLFHGRNFIYALRMEVKADSATVRSELPQEKPYRPLAETLPAKQREFTYNHIDGTVVALYFPSFFSGQNATGWHFHFLSDDKSKGGHLLKLSMSTPVQASFDITSHFGLYLPEETSFCQRDLSDNMTGEIRKVEK